MFGVSSIVPNTNIDGNDLHDSVKRAAPMRYADVNFSWRREERRLIGFPLMSGPTCSYGNRYMQHPGGLGKHVLFHVDFMAI